jgi:8-oxo-dGTP pyrophosphatase MutT (NUDIX family)
VTARWAEESFEPTASLTDAADAAVAELADRGSPSHDGIGARFISHEVTDDGQLLINLQPSRWSLRLNEQDAANSVAALCAVRDAEGRWLAGRRAQWLASWPGRWALGAGGAVDFGASPTDTLARELQEEWSVSAEQLRGEALVMLPNAMVMFVGQAWLAEGAVVTPDHEHDEHAWWPAQIEDWPEHADEPLRRMATLLSQVPR